MKRILLLSSTTSYNAKDFSAAARKLKVEVVPGTNRCRVLDDPWKDGALALNFTNPSESVQIILDYARHRPLDSIIAVGDPPIIVGALASRALGLPGNPPESIRTCRSKLLSRKILKNARLPVPNYQCIAVSQNPLRAIQSVNFPCVLKPLSLSTSQGVIRANNHDSFLRAFERIRRLLQSPQIRASQADNLDRILVEDYVDGNEFALEALLRNGRLKVLALFDKPDLLQGPFFEETLYVTPSRLPLELQDQIKSCCQNACQVLGLVDGPIHAEFRLNRQGPWILEVAPRTIGGLCSRTLSFGTGMSLEEIHLRHSLRMPIPSLQRETDASGVMMLPIPVKGHLQGVSGTEEALGVKGICKLSITAKPGQKLLPSPEGSSYLGFLFARGASPQEVEQALRKAHKQLKFEILPELPVV